MLDKILVSGKENQKMLSSMDKTLTAILNQGRSDAKDRKSAEKRAEQAAKRKSGDKGITSSMNKNLLASQKTHKLLEENNKLLGNLLKKKDGKNNNNGGGLIPAVVKPLAQAAKALAPAVVAVAKVAAGAAATVAALEGVKQLDNVTRSAVSNQVGGETKTKKGGRVTFENVVDHRNEFVRFNQGRGDDPAMREKLDQYATVMDQMKSRKTLNDQVFRLSERAEDLKDQPYYKKQREEILKRLKETKINLEQKSKMLEKSIAKLGIADEDMSRFTEARKNNTMTNKLLELFGGGQKKQTGGPITVPGSGSGDKVPMMLKPGSFVLNRNASKFLKRQTGGAVPTMLEPGELVYMNENIKRFQNGGLVRADHPDTGAGWSVGKDAQGRPSVFSKDAGEALMKAMKASDGAVQTSDITSSTRSPAKNAAVGGAAGSNHLSGEAVDIHGTSKAWLKESGLKYGWKNLVYSGHDGHFDYVGGGAGLVPGDGKEKTADKDDKKGGGGIIPTIAGIGGAIAGGIAGNMLGDIFEGVDPVLMGAILGPALLGTVQSFMGIDMGGDDSTKSTGSSTPGGDYGESSLIKAMDKAGMKDKKERAAFLAQMSHESGSFKYDEEIASGSDYEGRSDLGNTQAGDGKRFKGRGYIQLTGRENYKKFGGLVGQDLIENPDLAKDPNIAAAIALEYWNDRGLGAKARKGDFDAVTYGINGGYNGKADRDAKYQKYLTQSLQNGGMVQTLLEPGEMVFPQTTGSLKNLNSSIPRFQNGGSVDGIYDPEQAMNSPQIIVVNQAAPSGGGNGTQGVTSAGTSGVPTLSDGPSMAGLSDIINRVSWSNVF